MELKKPLVTVIVPNYNHEKYLEQRLESIFNQTYSNYEVILMDDCSTDNSLLVLNKYKNHEKVSASIFNENNTGNTFKQWAKGIQMAKGELIWIAETDDFCEAYFLEKLVQPFIKDCKVVLAYCQSNRVNENGLVTGNWITHTDDLDATLFRHDFTMDSNEFIELFLICKNVIPNASAVVFRKETIDLKQHFDIAPEFKYCGDWMFYFKMIINNKIFFVSDSLNYFRYHSTSVIAKAVQSENRISILDIDLAMRKVLMDYLSTHSVSNRENIKKRNEFIKREYIYEKAILLVRSGKNIKGFLLLLSVFDIFYKKFVLNKIKIKLKKIIKRVFGS